MSLNRQDTIDKDRIIQSMSEIYTSVYYVDLSSKKFVELSSAKRIHDQIGEAGDAQTVIQYFCNNMVEPSYRNEMLEFLDLSTLDERLKNKLILTPHIAGITDFTVEKIYKNIAENTQNIILKKELKNRVN